MRLLIVSNRLPITVLDEGELKFKESVGGLVTGLKAYLDTKGAQSSIDYTWIGWPGATIKDQNKEKLRSKVYSDLHAYPVFLSEAAMDKFYHGFCNRTIWPLFHYFTSNVVYDEEGWDYYKSVNEAFCEAILQIIRPDDVVWIHDYHLMLLPKLLREKVPGIPIGFFLHIPFPSYEVFRLLPTIWRTELLEGLLGSDLIGFHTHDYTQYFMRCVLRILGYENNMGQIAKDDHLVRVDTFPMGIDFNKFYNASLSPKVQAEKDDLKKVLGGHKIILSIDRLDYTKGVISRLLGYERFLEKNQQWCEKAVLVLMVVPSRTKVEHYQQMKRQIDELVGRINGKFGSIDWTPILYHYKFIEFDKLIALYSIADAGLVTPLRDGMNLIAKEYLATKTDGTGVLILSEMAGASKEVREAIIINPNDIGEIASALQEALEMPEDEQIRRNRIMQSRLRRHDVTQWADSFIQTLLSMKEDERSLDYKLLGPSARGQLIDDFLKAQKRLILLDYDGTLVKFASHPQAAMPTDEVMRMLKQLSENPKNEVVLLSGRDRITLQNWFGVFGIGLVAEHGAWIKKKNEEWRMSKPLTSDWKPKVLPILEMYSDRLPGSFIEDKDFSLAWHYRMADHERASIVSKELLDDLVRFTANIGVQVLQGNRVIEIRNPGMNKGDASTIWLAENGYNFILAMGDDWTDEDMFKILPETAYSIKVGRAQSQARYNLTNQSEVISLLQELAK
ncbi:MAG: bifunctional alpha,alpha-trehalose-phosphate synthase (UDP-forming)/trehalose-phosphatase [Methanotrichaceae archaeon]